jgi:outer membrane protease
MSKKNKKEKVEERTYTVDGVDYKESQLSFNTKNAIVIVNDLKQKQLIKSTELDQINMLIDGYMGRIHDELREISENKKDPN